MKSTAPLVRMTIALGTLVLVAMGFSVLALADIAHGEPDLDLEWATVRITALLMLMFIGLSFATIRRLTTQKTEAG